MQRCENVVRRAAPHNADRDERPVRIDTFRADTQPAWHAQVKSVGRCFQVLAAHRVQRGPRALLDELLQAQGQRRSLRTQGLEARRVHGHEALVESVLTDSRCRFVIMEMLEEHVRQIDDAPLAE